MMEVLDTEAALSRFRLRVLVVAAVVFLAFSVLVWRLVVLQVVRHEDLAERAESNRTAVVPIVPNRGQILDRNGVVLATNYSAYTLELTRSKIPDLEATIDELSALVEITPRDRRKFKRLVDDSKNFESLPIRTRLSEEEVARFAAQRYRFPGVDIKARLFRTYPLEDAASHVIGYIGRINQREKEQIDDSEDAANYRGTDVIGKLGIEQSYEKDLHGQTGWEQLETSAGGYAVRKLGSRAATPGDSLVLSLDIRLQRMIEELYGKRRGALVAIDPRNGEVLAMVSRPTFDLNLFVDGIDQESWAHLNESLDRPMLNRALRGTYPPGSTYKPFMALGALELGKRKTSTIVQDNGSWTFGGHTFRSGHPNGPVDMHRAIVKSSNVYFYQLANDMGVDAMHDFMKPLGFGQITGLDVRGEVRGVLPSQEWKRNTYKRPEQKKWYAGETISLGIGQGYNNFTLLQLSHAMATLANSGVKHQPHLGVGKVDALTRRYQQLPQPAGINMGYRPENVEAVRRAVAAVTVEGTARGIFAGAPYTSAGKTGTAQAVGVGQKEKYNASRLTEYQRDHSLYMAYAPAENPTIALALIVENAGFGAVAAGPIARRVFDYWLLGQYPSEEDIAAVRSGQSGRPIGQPRRANDIVMPAESVNLEGLPRKILPDPGASATSSRTALPTAAVIDPPSPASNAAWIPDD
ncbi:penicillin-binding protein 2 [Acidovorax sp. Be4]|uniref:Peptidoglycan D,D-transpeptidase MrdA n=1 Tax=Acidovorax bellezanensis TaxID=2976702 RepID=A0ABT2PLE6_9BURK|nr:penicillin-binding protein 2 [Acidovorax sp. Be4]MCT9811288.1 penicillin-binding protein 2 [Acidovorax sp. Be4]